MDNKYSVESYYGTDTNGHFFGLESSMETDEWSQVEEHAHEMLSSGKNVKITDKETGKSIEMVSDAYIENFEGEFPFKPQDLENNEQEKFDYQLLSRLQADCKYVLDTEVGENGVKLENAQFHLWAKNPEEQITKMRELYNAAPVKPEWITEEEINGYEKRFQDISDMEHGYPTRDEAIQYCLNQGTGIVNYYDTPVAELETAETTQAERDAAAKSGHEPREVSAETVDYFYEGVKEDDAMLYAVKNDMALLDLDEWQAIREATGLPLEWEDARTINNILYEGYDFTPLDIQANEKTTSIKEAILSDLSAEDESKIYEVLSKYENNRLMPENGQEFNHRLADSLEQVMFERGEYDFAESDRVRWLDNVPEPYALADDPATLQEARSTVTQNIENALNGELQDISAIKDYLKDQLAEMVEEDELIPTVEGYVKILEGMETIKEVEQMPTIETAAELEEALKSNKLTLEDVEDLKDRFSIVPMYEHLEENYGTAYELIDALGSDDIISIDSDVSYPEWTAEDNELDEIKDEISENVLGYLETLEPMLAVDKAGNEAVIPIYRNLDGKLLSADDVNKAISELVPEKVEITLYGEKIDHDYYTQPYHPERQVEADVDTTFDAVDFLLKEAKECVNEVKYDYYRQKDSELIYDMIESVNCSVKVNEAGTYDVCDSVKGEYRATDCEDLLQVIDSLDTLVENNLLDYTANELYQSDDFEKHGEGVEIPQTAEEWKAIFDSPDFAEFSAGHQTEMQEIALLADPNRLKDANIEYVANTFYPEDKEYTAYQLQALCKDKTVFMHGGTYTATTDAEKVFAEPSYSSLYKIELNKADMTFDVRDTDDIRAVKEQELSATLADFINSKDMELDVIETNGFNRYVLYDKDTGDYRKDESGKAEYLHNAEDLLTNMNVYVEEVQYDLEEAFLDTYGDSKEVPSIASEWVSFAGRESNSEFVKDCKAELDLMRLAHEPNSASISKVYEMQNERQEQAKEQPAKNHKKFDKTDD